MVACGSGGHWPGSAGVRASGGRGRSGGAGMRVSGGRGQRILERDRATSEAELPQAWRDAAGGEDT